MALGGCAHLAELRRLRVGSFGIAEAHPLDAVAVTRRGCVLTPGEAMRDLEPIVVPATSARRLARRDVRGAFAGAGNGGPRSVRGGRRHEQLLAVYERRGAGVKPAVVLRSDS